MLKDLQQIPSLMRQAGAKNYKTYCSQILKNCQNKPISFEVFADDYKNMLDQAYKLNSLERMFMLKYQLLIPKASLVERSLIS